MAGTVGEVEPLSFPETRRDVPPWLSSIPYRFTAASIVIRDV